MTQPRPFYWSVRRELWENRSIYLAPLIVAAVVTFASMLGSFGLPSRVRRAQTMEPAKRHSVIITHYSMAPAPIMFTTLLVGLFYSLDAMYGERRDRSILFWKSMPVSDNTTVLAKASIPLLALPAIAIVLGTIAQMILMSFGTIVLSASGLNPGLLWSEFRFIQEPIIAVYGMGVHALWYAPIYAWLMLISAWARRAPFLWAILPPLLIAAVERIVFGTYYFMYMLQYRVMGAMREAFSGIPKHGSGVVIDQIDHLSPLKLLSAPGLWVGLLFAAACFIAAARLRRYREPI